MLLRVAIMALGVPIPVGVPSVEIAVAKMGISAVGGLLGIVGGNLIDRAVFRPDDDDPAAHLAGRTHTRRGDRSHGDSDPVRTPHLPSIKHRNSERNR